MKYKIKYFLYWILKVSFWFLPKTPSIFEPTLVETDFNSAIDMINKGASGLWEGGGLILDINDLADDCDYCSLSIL